MNDKFEEYVTSWFRQYIEDHEEDEDLLLSLFNTICPREEDDSLFDWLDEDETICDWLLNCSAEDIYSNLFGEGGHGCFDDMPDAEGFVTKMLKDVSNELDLDKYEFADEFLADMAYHITNYDNPLSFFQDLQHGGCASGMIGMVIYNSDCLTLYGKYANDMEEFREELEEEIGSPIKRDKALRHYVWICWLCYEELAYQIGRYLFENNL